MIRHATGLAPGPMDTLALGTGDGAVSKDDTTLDNEIYRNSETAANVTFVENDDSAHYVDAIITVGGGTEVPADSRITEMGIIVSATSPETLVFRDVGGASEIDSGWRIPQAMTIGIPP